MAIWPRGPSARCTNSMVATIAPGPASSGVPSGTSATLEVDWLLGSSALPVSSSSATSRSSSRPAPCSAGRSMQVVQDLLAGHREDHDHARASATACTGGPAPLAGRHRPGQRQEDRHHAGRVGDHQQGHEDLAEQLHIHAIIVPIGRPASRRISAEHGRVGQVGPERDGLVRAVEVARAGDHQAQPVGQRPHLGPLLGGVVLVVGLEPGQPAGGQLHDQLVGHDPAPLGRPRVGEDRHPAGRRGPAAAPGTRRCRPWAAATARPAWRRERLADRAHQPAPDQRLREVRAADRTPGRVAGAPRPRSRRRRRRASARRCARPGAPGRRAPGSAPRSSGPSSGSK